MRAAGLSEDYHLHTFRHTFVSKVLRDGENILKLKEWLGHSSVKVTEVYVHDKPQGAVEINVK
ncbi:tyrosine-type recombinase/integrase [Candidatus Latescibacterota bacterium]